MKEPDDLNKVLITGRLTKDISTNRDEKGRLVVGGNVATHRSWVVSGGTRKEETVFFEFEAWGMVAECMKDQVKRGCKVLLEGKCKQDSWERDGVSKAKMIIVVGYYQLLCDSRLLRQGEG